MTDLYAFSRILFSLKYAWDGEARGSKAYTRNPQEGETMQDPAQVRAPRQREQKPNGRDDEATEACESRQKRRRTGVTSETENANKYGEGRREDNTREPDSGEGGQRRVSTPWLLASLLLEECPFDVLESETEEELLLHRIAALPRPPQLRAAVAAELFPPLLRGSSCPRSSSPVRSAIQPSSKGSVSSASSSSARVRRAWSSASLSQTASATSSSESPRRAPSVSSAESFSSSSSPHSRLPPPSLSRRAAADSKEWAPSESVSGASESASPPSSLSLSSASSASRSLSALPATTALQLDGGLSSEPLSLSSFVSEALSRASLSAESRHGSASTGRQDGGLDEDATAPTSPDQTQRMPALAADSWRASMSGSLAASASAACRSVAPASAGSASPSPRLWLPPGSAADASGSRAAATAKALSVTSPASPLAWSPAASMPAETALSPTQLPPPA
ncbi:zinc finger, C3HC4 type (RING finger) domain-containing protein [Besnoitia besnoiti]|uniref:Zinc finger, C3HC4 type (RING finger) domain-containing protein n=1 Tax=Besnoitia besnoiti TaxID=94643 RepID=A0A2A9MFW7_BESBE|nr:zinc finger, C3HC4 type (RING finger) domain-containing protein [Besnoitia besnoiti]PFH37388.1 zinc finger, C3HC4 type (RING finger) domain-containing protein [Besnoitia besnoiti]